jgi:hypothetical protein
MAVISCNFSEGTEENYQKILVVIAGVHFELLSLPAAGRPTALSPMNLYYYY